MKLIPGQSLKAVATINNNINTLPDGDSAAWTSSDEGVATVTPSPANPLEATVTGVMVGKTTITCIVTDHTQGVAQISGTASQIVENPPAPVTSVTVAIG